MLAQFSFDGPVGLEDVIVPGAPCVREHVGSMQGAGRCREASMQSEHGLTSSFQVPWS